MTENASSRSPRYIVHVDMDAFYASIEQRDDPSLREKPVIIGSPPDRRGVVSTASYEAREFGVHSAMPSRTAGKLCPHGVFLSGNMSKYSDVSGQVMTILRSYTPLVEPISIDEAFLDITSAVKSWIAAEKLGHALKAQIQNELSLTASVGLACNKFLAKLASDMDKPNGLTVVPADPREILTFLAPLPVSRIWGVGKVAQARLKRFGIETVSDAQRHDQSNLQRWLGNAFGEHLWRLCRGLDDRPLVTEHEAKSISNEHTFIEDCDDPAVVRQVLIRLTEQVGRRLRQSEKVASTGQIKLRFDDFNTITRQRSLRHPTATDHEILGCSLTLFDAQNIHRPIRLVGFGVAGLSGPESESPTQPELFEMPEEQNQKKHESLDRAVDRIREKFGKDALKRGGSEWHQDELS
jgi:DNA polymerase-4